MNISRFQLSLNHDDPSVVILGLKEFRLQVLSDHKAHVHFGYNGRNCLESDNIVRVLHPDTPETITGVLHEYILKSPQIEELFVLWTLPNRDEDKALCAAHMACLAAILHCGQSNQAFCNTIVSRILCDFTKTLHAQLASGHVELIHSTLGLLLSMMRTSVQNCKDVFQKNSLPLSSPNLDAIVQKGKSVSWETAEGESVSTDSRALVILVVLLALEVSDESSVLELFAERSLMRKIMHSVGRDVNATVDLTLLGVVHAAQLNPVLHTHFQDMVDPASVKQLLLLYAHKDEDMRARAHSFMLGLVQLMKQSMHGAKRSSRAGQAVGISVSRCCGFIAQCLQPHADANQGEVCSFVVLSALCFFFFFFLVFLCFSALLFVWLQVFSGFLFFISRVFTTMCT
jgi:hypothetical protein